MPSTPTRANAPRRSRARRGAVAVAGGLLVFAVPATAEPPPPGNLIANPSFERDIDEDWIGFRSTITSLSLPGEAPDGSRVVRVVGGPAADTVEGFSVDDDAPSGGASVPAGTQFVASAYMRADGPQSIGKLGKVWVREQEGDVLVGSVNSEAPLTGAFQLITAPVYTTQRAGSEVDAYVAQNPAVPGDAFQADLVTLSRNLPPTGVITTSVGEPVAGDVVVLSSATVSDPEGVGIASRAWDLDGDGVFTDGSGVTKTRTFASAGTFTVALRVADDAGATAVLTRRVIVRASGTPRGGGGGTGTGGSSGRPASFTLSARQLLINQRIGQAAIRRLNAIEAKLDGRPAPPDRRSGRAGQVTLSARQLLINQRIYQAGVRRANALEARIEGRAAPAAPARGTAGDVRLTLAQLVINQRIAQAAVRRANALKGRVGL